MKRLAKSVDRYIERAHSRRSIRPSDEPERGLCKPPNRGHLLVASCRHDGGANCVFWRDHLRAAFAARPSLGAIDFTIKRFARSDLNLG